MPKLPFNLSCQTKWTSETATLMPLLNVTGLWHDMLYDAMQHAHMLRLRNAVCKANDAQHACVHVGKHAGSMTAPAHMRQCSRGGKERLAVQVAKPKLEMVVPYREYKLVHGDGSTAARTKKHPFCMSRVHYTAAGQWPHYRPHQPFWPGWQCLRLLTPMKFIGAMAANSSSNDLVLSRCLVTLLSCIAEEESAACRI